MSSQMFIEPEAILAENKFLINEGVGDSLDRMVVDLDAAIITPVHKMVCQMSELSRGQNKFGSCGMGVGETVRDKEKGLAITVRDIGNERVLRDKMEVLGRARFEIAKKLRSPTGCPWDRKKTIETLLPDFLGEVKEVEEAIQKGDMKNLKEELLAPVQFKLTFTLLVIEESGTRNV